jgi:aspartyl-tRNA(Asn)/glutamyl-tRNA(Gln) amidotransferase subunit C
MAKAADLDIDYVAKLARLELSEQEKTVYAAQLSDIITYFQKLSEVDTQGVEPTAHANPIFDVLREDNPGQAFDQETALANAPKSAEGQIVVPRVIE